MVDTNNSLPKTALRNINGGLRGAGKLALVFGFAGLVGLPLVTWYFGVTVDDAVIFLAVPLSILYLLWRILRMSVSPADKVTADAQTRHVEVKGEWVIVVLAVGFALGLPVLGISLLSALLYKLLALEWAVSPALHFSKWVFYGIAGSALPIACVSICRLWNRSVMRAVITLLALPRIPRRILAR